MKIVGLIPSRLESVRLPGKVILNICDILYGNTYI